MNDPAFHRDCFLTELDTDVVGIGEEDGLPFAELADTIFYPEGGGQPADRGTIAGVEVVDVRKTGSAIRHYLTRAVTPGPARLSLDWNRRWDHMQQHTAQHLLTAVALRDFGWATTAFHLGPDSSDIELDVPRLSRNDLDRLEDACASEVRAGRAIGYRNAEVVEFEKLGVRSRRLPEGFEGPVRLVEIQGLDLNTCGGTHLRSTAEIGTLCLVGTEPMRGGSRLFFVAGDRVRRRMADHEARNKELRSLLDTGDNELVDIVRVRINREKSLAQSTRRLSEELAETTAANLAARSEEVVNAHWDDRDMAFLQQVGRKLAAAAPRKRALLTASDGGDAFVVVAGSDAGLDLETAGPRIAEILEGRGGGKGEVFQGKAGSLARRQQAIDLLLSS